MKMEIVYYNHHAPSQLNKNITLSSSDGPLLKIPTPNYVITGLTPQNQTGVSPITPNYATSPQTPYGGIITPEDNYYNTNNSNNNNNTNNNNNNKRHYNQMQYNEDLNDSSMNMHSFGTSHSNEPPRKKTTPNHHR